jgi:transcriptional regulator with XRE-family HTH domain
MLDPVAATFTGRGLRHLRTMVLRVSQAELARRLGLARSTVAHYEAAATVPLWLEYAVRWLVHDRRRSAA